MKKWLMGATGALAILALAACASAQKEVYGGAAVLTTLEQAATVYAKWPACGSAGATALCSEQAVEDKIAAADQAAYAAVRKAMNIVDDPNAGNDAISAAINLANVALAGLASLIPDAAEAAVNGGAPVEVQ